MRRYLVSTIVLAAAACAPDTLTAPEAPAHSSGWLPDGGRTADSAWVRQDTTPKRGIIGSGT